MTRQPDIVALAANLVGGRLTEEELSDLTAAQTSELVERLFERAGGRRWLRGSSLLTAALAERLIAYEDDFSPRRHDASLERAVRAANPDTVLSHAVAIAAGSGAPELWSRLARDPARFQNAFDAVLRSDDARAVEATATHLLLDPAERYGLSDEWRREIAAAILGSDFGAARGIAAEFLATAAPEVLASRVDELARDDSASVRGFTWLAAFRVDRRLATERVTDLLGNETVDDAMRRSALNAAGEILPTDQMIGLLSYFVVHPTPELALDAANLLHRHHRHPEIAIAAAGSPHDAVREIAERLLDPYRGSPAAGGSRPGDPLRSDPLIELMRRLEEETKA